MNMMMNRRLPGTVNGPMVGIVMKEMVRRAMASIARNRMNFVATEKESYKAGQDFVTTADREAQQIYLRTLSETFPTYGVIAEEDNLRTDCLEKDEDIYFTIDPLDGTKAFMRRQSQGIGTMISLVRGDVVVAACVGDVMTKEIYYFRPDSEKVHRFSWGDELGETLKKERGSDELSEQYLLLGDDPRSLSLEIEEMTRPDAKGRTPIFKNIEIMSGSIGVKMARLWKGEVGAVVIKAGKATPWDWCPVAGISAKLGFVSVSFISGEWMSAPLGPIKDIEEFGYDSIIIHTSQLEDFMSRTVWG